MAYVDGFVVPVPRKNLKAYRSMAQKAGKVWRDQRRAGGEGMHRR
jgi:uncharacterized protein YbaA (DUF1428 family)